jgi:hypothetical protein
MSDGSHPSMAGSYAAACAFYTMMFGRDPDSITYEAGLSPKTAHLIRLAVHDVVYDSLWKWQRPEPSALPIDGQDLEIYVSPNPTCGEITLHLPEGIKADIFLFSVDNRILLRKTTQGATRLSLDGMPTGVYLLKLVTHQGIVFKRIVKQ